MHDENMSNMDVLDVVTRSTRPQQRLAGVVETDGQQAIRVGVEFVERLLTELESVVESAGRNPHLRMASSIMRSHLDCRPLTASSAIAASGVPHATAVRRLQELIEADLVERRARTRTGKTFSLHPTATLIKRWAQLADRLPRLAEETLARGAVNTPEDYYFGGSYRATQVIQPPQVLAQPLRLAGGLRVLVHADPTFMVMEGLKRQFEQIVGTSITQRAFSIDRLYEEGLRNAARETSRYDILAVDLPWIGEYAERGVLLPLDNVMDVDRLDPADFLPAGWQAAHWGGHIYGVPSQTTPELLFYRRDLFAAAGLEPPATTDDVLRAAEALHDPARGVSGIAWNAARGTALGHTFMMACADFGQPLLRLPKIAGGFDATKLARSRSVVPTIDTPRALEAVRYLMALRDFSPPDVLSMSWYERVRAFTTGRVAMAYGYTLLAPHFERDPSSPAHGQTGYLPHPSGGSGPRVAPIGGYVLGIPRNLPAERRAAAAEALVVFTSREAQKLFVQNGSRAVPRYSVGADPEVKRLSPIFDAVDAMGWRDELQFWPRPPIPQMPAIVQVCGEEIHDVLRGTRSPGDALARAQERAQALFQSR